MFDSEYRLDKDSSRNEKCNLRQENNKPSYQKQQTEGIFNGEKWTTTGNTFTA